MDQSGQKTLETTRPYGPWALCVAPMMDWTDRHCRYFHRLLAPHARLYTEMVTTGAIIHGDRARHLDFDAAEHPLALQLGGHEPAELAQCARIGADWGYDEINLNVGCPSDRVQSGRFGACLMREPALVADCVAAMRAAVSVPVTVKCRIGVDEQDDYEDLHRFVETLVGAGLETLIVHARKAWLHGLSPKENREIPPLNYERVYRLRQEFPQLTLAINGGIVDVVATKSHCAIVDGVMLGRAAYHDPYVLAQCEHALFGTPLPDRDEVLYRMQPYIEAKLARGGALNHVTRHILGLYHGLPGARAFRRTLSERMHRSGADFRVVEQAMAGLREHAQAA
ncbi:MAG: tRNA dihydrouridine(20/20a) synthase DusA [Rudaea sp.]|uniref:tRNA dihydrouridine(20/20a) synthase DusA n=1 Tax=unclassified Rudaea TaxID=2627037 RepID=UPI0010F7E0FC|nr:MULTISPECIES: tRNA dihydrouridine(20/20a) synthase DusA [unclassified Rudaea]MBN8885226.1 tRNA dihydrouridine(20/20a) synthase DusA [Rudaea sp.]MBR0345453.1 tRNA dihydrouridine(20/20a) synthase DusA [Rudaea sp.]